MYLSSYPWYRQGSMLSETEEKQLIQSAQQGNKDARASLIEHHIPFVVSMVGFYCPWGSPIFLDLVDEAIIDGLSHAIDKFDEKRGTRLATYARFWVRDTLLKVYRQKPFLSLEMLLTQATFEERYCSSDEDWETKRLECLLVRQWISQAKLTKKEALVISLLFGLDGSGVHTQQDVGNLLQVTRSAIYKTEQRALKKLRSCANQGL